MVYKTYLLFYLATVAIFAVSCKGSNDKTIGSGVAEEEDEQGSGKDNIAVKEENGKARATPFDLQQRYWPICEQLRQFTPQLCLRQSVADKCDNVCTNVEPVLDCGIKIPMIPSKKKNKKKKQLKNKKQPKTNKQQKKKKDQNKKIGKGKTDKGSKRIVGGKESAQNEWNWQVSLFGKYNATHGKLCGGAILSKNFILTAGHCVGDARMNNASAWKVTVGDHNLRIDEWFDTDHQVKHIMRHRNYGRFRGNPTSDVAIFQLETAIAIEELQMGRICLPDEDKPIPDHGKTCYVTGWGLTQEDGQISDILKHAPVLMVPTLDCNRPLNYNGRVDNTMFCAGHKLGGTDSCEGDSGGSLACKMGSGLNARWYSGGVVSWGEGCARPKRYGVYANTTYFKDWIVDTILDQSVAL